MATIPQNPQDHVTRLLNDDRLWGDIWRDVQHWEEFVRVLNSGDTRQVEGFRAKFGISVHTVLDMAHQGRRELIWADPHTGGRDRFDAIIAYYQTVTAPAALPPAAAQSMIAPLPATAKPDMTPTQKKYSELLREGYTPADIARILQIEPGTANTEISKARRQHGEYWYPKRNAKKPKNT